MDGEIWKDIKGYEEYYKISNYGRIYSKERFVKTCGNGRRIVGGRIVNPVKCTNGYLEVQMHIKGKVIIKLLHRAVAEAFLPNPDNLPEVNHKDEDISNNTLQNLEWCTSKYNANYGTRNKRFGQKFKKPVLQYDLNGNFIKRWDGVIDASKGVGARSECIIRCCKNRQETSAGYKWEYA